MEQTVSLSAMQTDYSAETAIFGGIFSFAMMAIIVILSIAMILMPIFVWQMHSMQRRMEDRTIAMRRMMRLMEDHLRAIRVAQTGEQLEPRDPAL